MAVFLKMATDTEASYVSNFQGFTRKAARHLIEIILKSSIASALEPFLFSLFLRLSARRHLRPSGAR